MQRFRDMSIAHKLRLTTALTNVLALLIVASAYIVFERVTSRQEMVRMLTVLADEVGLHGAAALSFRDESAARETLAGLQADPHVKAGTLFDQSGSVFATYRRDDAVTPLAALPAQETLFRANSVLLTRPVMLNDKRIGTVCVESDLELLRQRLLRLAGIVVVAIVAALVLTIAFTLILQRSISGPINALAGVARSISERKEYSVRAVLPVSHDEIGLFTAAFNQMLEGIQEREAAQRHAQEALEHSETLLNEMGRMARVGGWEFSIDARRLVWTDEVYRIHEVGMDYHPTVSEGISFYAPTSRPIIERAVQRAIEHGEPFDVELEIVTAKGNVRSVHSVGRVDAEGRKVFGTFQDITERKQAENELRKHRLHLEELVEGRTAELQKTNEELERTAAELQRSNQELEQFAYVASHDLQEPLRKVASFTQLLAARCEGKLDAEAMEFITFAVDGAHRMQGLITDLLAYSRVGTRGKTFAPVSCETVLEEALANLEWTIKESGAVVTHEELPAVMGDDTQLVQLFQNLIGNAIKFHRPDVPPEVHISVRCVTDEEYARMGVSAPANDGQTSEDQRNDETTPPSAALWLFSVRDNGIGIEPQYFERLFVIFQRLHSRGKYPGTGIGLAISKKVVERHGGRLWVESEPGNGSTFHFTIGVINEEGTRREP